MTSITLRIPLVQRKDWKGAVGVESVCDWLYIEETSCEMGESQYRNKYLDGQESQTNLWNLEKEL